MSIKRSATMVRRVADEAAQLLCRAAVAEQAAGLAAVALMKLPADWSQC